MAGRHRQAEAIYRQVLKAQPDNADALHLLGVLARQSGQPAAAIELIQRAISLNGRNPSYHANLGTALEVSERRDDAIAAYRRALDIKADYPEAHFKLGAALEAAGQHGEAAPSFRRAIECKPDYAEAHHMLGTVLAALGRTEDAIAAQQKALEINPDYPEALVEMGRGFRKIKRSDDAIAAFKRAIAIKPSFDNGLFFLSIALLERENPKEMLEVCDTHLERNPGNVRMLALKAIALNDLGMHDALNALCDYDRFLRPKQFEAPAGYDSLADFNADFERYVCAHPTLAFERSGHATRFGGHTGDLFLKPGGPAQVFEGMVRSTVEDYMNALPDEPDHPYLGSRPRKWRLQAWAVVMDTKGHQLPHIHPAAWVSGVYYVKVPAVTDSEGSQEGWIEFGKPEPSLRCTVEPELKRYKPEEGLMFLFPSYFYHHTVPFETAERRISIAFDVVPEN
jgi:tetratricopeptide (TPR) repeat protein